jgi:hypothetical protein
MRLRKAFLWSMIVSLCLAALLGIVALLLPDFVRKDEQILVSTVLFALYSLLALCCSIVMEKRRLVTLMWLGIAGAAAGLVLWLVVIWFDPLMGGRTEENIVRAAGTFTTPAVLFAQCGLLLLPRLDGPWAAVMRRGTIVVSAMLAATIVFMIWWWDWIDNYIDDEILGRGMGVLGILTACGTVITPIVWKVQAVHRVDSVDSIPSRLRVDIKCPRCETQQQLRTGPAKCATCGLRITVQIEEPRCTCGYQLYRLESEHCPECGREVPETDRWAAAQSADPSRT